MATGVDLAFLLRRDEQEPGDAGTLARITPTRRRVSSRSQDVTATGLQDARTEEPAAAPPNQDSCDMLPDAAPRRPDTVPRSPSGTSNPTLEVPTVDDSLITNSISSEQGEAAVDELVQRIEFLADEGKFEDAYDLAEMMMATSADDARVRGAWKYAREVRYKCLVQRLVPLSRIPRLTDRTPIMNARLEPGTMFVLGLVDGFMNIEDIIDVSGLPQADAMAGLLKLIVLQLIEI